MGMDIITDFDKHENDPKEDDSTYYRDNYYRDNIICPYCGYEDTESWEYLRMLEPEEVFEIDCLDCGKTFNIFYETFIYWHANKI